MSNQKRGTKSSTALVVLPPNRPQPMEPKEEPALRWRPQPQKVALERWKDTLRAHSLPAHQGVSEEEEEEAWAKEQQR